MATDATGTPSALLSIPKYNPDADAPSGLGLNAIVDSLDTLVDARVTKPASPSLGDGLVWNGTGWVKTSAGGGGTNEVQTVTITGTPTGGTFTLTFNGETTATIAHNATAAAVQSALEALTGIGVGDVLCAGGPFPDTAVTVTFQGALGTRDVVQMTAAHSFTGGTTPDIAVATTTPGVAQTKLAVAGLTPGTQGQVLTIVNGVPTWAAAGGAATPQTAEASAALTLTTTPTDIAGTTLTLPATGYWLVIGTFDFFLGATGDPGSLVGHMVTTGTRIGVAATALFDPRDSIGDFLERATISQTWIVQVTAVGQTVKLQGSKSAAGGTWHAGASHTTIRAIHAA